MAAYLAIVLGFNRLAIAVKTKPPLPSMEALDELGFNRLAIAAKTKRNQHRLRPSLPGCFNRLAIAAKTKQIEEKHDNKPV